MSLFYFLQQLLPRYSYVHAFVSIDEDGYPHEDDDWEDDDEDEDGDDMDDFDSGFDSDEDDEDWE